MSSWYGTSVRGKSLQIEHEGLSIVSTQWSVDVWNGNGNKQKKQPYCSVIFTAAVVHRHSSTSLPIRSFVVLSFCWRDQLRTWNAINCCGWDRRMEASPHTGAAAALTSGWVFADDYLTELSLTAVCLYCVADRHMSVWRWWNASDMWSRSTGRRTWPGTTLYTRSSKGTGLGSNPHIT